jgi:protein tyrosine phosphatase
VTWLSPQTSNGILKGYRVKYDRTDGVLISKNADVVGSTTLKHVILNLQEYTNYSVSVQAFVFGPGNMDLNSNYSQPVVVQTTAEVPSGSPISVVVTPQSSTLMSLSWAQPELDDRNGKITGYRLTYYPMDNKSSVISRTVNVPSAEVDGLERYTSYCFQVAARSHFTPKDGRDVYGPNSTLECKRTNEDVPGDAPLVISITAISSTKVQITWKPPTIPNGVIIAYRIEYSMDRQPVTYSATEFTNTSGGVVENLEFYTFYCFKVAARTNASGSNDTGPWGPFSSEQCIRTNEDKPGAPQNVTARQVSSDSINVSWLVPARKNGIISHYTVYYRNGNITDSTELNETVFDNRTSVTITRLDPFTVHAIQVTATTGGGEGNRSGIIKEQTDESTPGEPASPSVTNITATSAVFQWAPPTKPNGILVNYSLTITTDSRPQKTDIFSVGQQTYHAVELNEYSNYSAQIRAATSKGFGDAVQFEPFQTLQAAPAKGPSIISSSIKTTNDSLTFSWELLSEDDQNGVIINYTVTIVDDSSNQTVNSEIVTEQTFTQGDLTPFTSYSVKIRASTVVGTGPSSLRVIRTNEAAPEDSPSNVMTRVLSSQSLFVSWGPILNISKHNGIIEAYTLKLTNNESDIVKQTNVISDANIREWTYENLEEYVVYCVEVAGATSAGVGPFSIPVCNQTFQDAPSGPPQNLRTEVLNFSAIQVMWDPPLVNEQNGIIQGYQLNYMAFQGNFSKTKNISGTYFVASNLTAFTQYRFSIVAFTIIGPGPVTAVQNTTEEDIPFDAPRNLRAFNKTTVNGANANVTFSWSPPLIPNGIITHYNVEVFLANTKYVIVNVSSTTNDTRLVVDSKLDKFTWYEARVQAATKVGAGPFSDTIRFLTDEDVPEMPGNFSIVSQNETVVIVSWSRPPDDHGIRLGYQLNVTNAHYLLAARPSNNSEPIPPEKQRNRMSFSNLKAVDNQLKIINLHPFAQYTLILQARTAKGLGDEAKLIVTTSPSSPTGPVVNLTSFANSTASGPEISVSWKPPVVDLRNNVILAYEVIFRRTDKTNVQRVVHIHEGGSENEQSFQRGGLKAYRWYNFTVSACSDNNTLDCGPPTSEVVRTLQEAPGAPINLMSEAVTSTSIQISWNPPDAENINGVLQNYTIYWFRTEEQGESRSSECVDDSVTTFTIRNLEKYASYRISVSATTIKEGNESQSLVVRTSEDKPGRVDLQPVTLVASSTAQGNKLAANLRWQRPVPNGIIIFYEVSIVGMKSSAGNNEVITDFVKTFKASAIENNDDLVRITIGDLQGNTTYDFKVRANTSIGYGDFSNIRSNSTPTTEPPGPTGLIEVGIILNSATFVNGSTIASTVTTTTLPAVFQEASDENGAITHYAIIVLEVPSELKDTDPKSYFQYRSSTAKQRPPFYAFFGRPTELEEITVSSRKKRADTDDKTLLYLLGTDMDCQEDDGICNGELLPGTSYRFKTRAYTQTKDSDPAQGLFTESNFSEPFSTNSESDDSFPVAAVVVPIMVVLIVVCAVLIFILLHQRRRQSKLTSLEMSNKRNVSKSELRRPSFIVRNRDAADIRPRLHSLHPLRNHPNLSRPVAISHFAKHVVRMSADTDFKFSEEFETVQGVGLEGTTEASLMDENRPKNRYTNILAYDHSRVKLTFTDDEPGSDYINSNYVHGYNMPRAFIATQGPMPNTFDDFWRMVWEQNSSTIVMLTQLQEKGRTKCHQYWPDEEPVTYGDIEVSKVSEKNSPNWDIREFTMQYSKQTRNVKQFQFTTWPDMGVPEEPSIVVDFVRFVRAQQPADAGPMVVHCSAGVGRTGTFVCIDTVLRRMREKDTVDVFGVVSAMRLQRNHMVQTEAQYIFIHKAILEVIQQMNLDKPSSTPPTTKTDNIYANTGELREQALSSSNEEDALVEESKM